VAREHKKRGIKMAPLTLAMQVMTGQLRLCHCGAAADPAALSPRVTVLHTAAVAAGC